MYHDENEFVTSLLKNRSRLSEQVCSKIYYKSIIVRLIIVKTLFYLVFISIVKEKSYKFFNRKTNIFRERERDLRT